METRILISKLTDRPKALRWFKEKAGWTNDRLKSLDAETALGVAIMSDSIDVERYLEYAHEWGVEEVERVSTMGSLVQHAGCDPLVPPKPEECGFEVATSVRSTDDEDRMFMEKIKVLKEQREVVNAVAWVIESSPPGENSWTPCDAKPTEEEALAAVEKYTANDFHRRYSFRVIKYVRERTWPSGPTA